MRILNLGILAHVDAGKTTLTERLLFAAGIIDEIGSVDDGNTQTDYLPLERQRGITIKSAVVSFVIDDVTVNLIDTPGHPDFIAEVERVLNVLDGAVLVVSAVEGVQPQTRVLMRALKRLRIPALVFINKIDRLGASPEGVLDSISERLTPAIVPMGRVIDPGSRRARYVPHELDDPDFVSRLFEVLADNDDVLLSSYLEGDVAVPTDELFEHLRKQTMAALVHPVFFGSAITGAGVEPLMRGIRELLPVGVDDDGPAAGTVFKVERGPAGEKVAYVRMTSGALRVRDRVQFGRDRGGKVVALSVFDRGLAHPSASVSAGRIAKLWGLSEVQIGDTIGAARGNGRSRHFDPPTLEAVVVPRVPAQRAALHAALAQLAEQDPLINVRQNDLRRETYVSLYGDVQKEVIQATLSGDYGIDVEFRETSPICVERVTGSGQAVERLGRDGNPFLATVGLRVEPASFGSGVLLRSEAELVSVPLYIYRSVELFYEALESTVKETLQQGLYGWQVTDCTVTLTECGYASPSSTARDFRLLAPLVVMSALKEAGTEVCEPIDGFQLEVPEDAVRAALGALARLDAVLDTSTGRGSSCTLEGKIPVTRVPELQRQLPALTRGEGTLEHEFACYRIAGEPIPMRPRSDHNPLNRKEYLLHVVRRV